MTSQRTLRLKTVSSFIILCLLAQDAGLAASELKVHAELKPSSFSIPSYLGIVKDSADEKSPNIIINIKDIHDNFSAQESISGILENLVANYSVKTIGIEGASGPVDSALLAALPDDAMRKNTGEYLLKEGSLSAGEFFAAMNDENIAVYGMDDEKLYEDNLAYYKKCLENKKDYFVHAQALLQKVRGLAERTYSAELAELDKNGVMTSDGNIKFSQRWKVISSLAEKHGIDYRAYPSIRTLLESLRREKEVRFDDAGHERDRLLDHLSQRLDGEDLRQLVEQSIAYKLGRVSQGSYSTYLLDKAGAGGYPELRRYAEYMTIYESLDVETLKEEVSALEDSLREKLFRNPAERETYRLVHDIQILSDLFEVKLSSDSLQYFKSHREDFEAQALLKRVKQAADGQSLTIEVKDIQMLVDGVSDFMPFYESAEKRNEALLKNTMDRMRAQGTRVACLVTGGFHSRGITDLMKSQKVSYIVILPRYNRKSTRPYITVVTQQAASYREFLQSRQALETRLKMTAHYFAQVAFQAIKDQGAVSDEKKNSLIQAAVARQKASYEASLADRRNHLEMSREAAASTVQSFSGARIAEKRAVSADTQTLAPWPQIDGRAVTGSMQLLYSEGNMYAYFATPDAGTTPYLFILTRGEDGVVTFADEKTGNDAAVGWAGLENKQDKQLLLETPADVSQLSLDQALALKKIIKEYTGKAGPRILNESDIAEIKRIAKRKGLAVSGESIAESFEALKVVGLETPVTPQTATGPRLAEGTTIKPEVDLTGADARAAIDRLIDARKKDSRLQFTREFQKFIEEHIEDPRTGRLRSTGDEFLDEDIQREREILEAFLYETDKAKVVELMKDKAKREELMRARMETAGTLRVKITSGEEAYSRKAVEEAILEHQEIRATELIRFAVKDMDPDKDGGVAIALFEGQYSQKKLHKKSKLKDFEDDKSIRVTTVTYVTTDSDRPDEKNSLDYEIFKQWSPEQKKEFFKKNTLVSVVYSYTPEGQEVTKEENLFFDADKNSIVTIAYEINGQPFTEDVINTMDGKDVFKAAFEDLKNTRARLKGLAEDRTRLERQIAEYDEAQDKGKVSKMLNSANVELARINLEIARRKALYGWTKTASEVTDSEAAYRKALENGKDRDDLTFLAQFYVDILGKRTAEDTAKDKDSGESRQKDLEHAKRNIGRVVGMMNAGLDNDGKGGLIGALEELQKIKAMTVAGQLGINDTDKQEEYFQKFRNGKLTFAESIPINDIAYAMFERIVGLSERQELVAAIQQVDTKSGPEVFKTLAKDDPGNKQRDERHIYTAFLFRKATGKYLMNKQLLAIAKIGDYNLAAGTGTGKTVVLFAAAAQKIIEMINGERSEKGAVIIDVANTALLEQFLSNPWHQNLVDAMVGKGKVELVNGKKRLLDVIQTQQDESSVMKELDSLNIIVIDMQSAGFLRQSSRTIQNEVSRKLERRIEYVDEGDALYTNLSDYVGSFGGDNRDQSEAAKKRRAYQAAKRAIVYELSELRDNKARELLKGIDVHGAYDVDKYNGREVKVWSNGSVKIVNDYEYFREKYAESTEKVLFLNESNREIMANQAVRNFFETEDRLRMGDNDDAKGFRIDGMDMGHIQTALTVALLNDGEVRRFRHVTYDASKNSYIFVASGQLKTSQIPGDLQLLRSLNQRRKELDLERRNLREKDGITSKDEDPILFADDFKTVTVLDTSGGVSGFELFRKDKDSKAFIRMASATQGEVVEFGVLMQGVGVFDVDTFEEYRDRVAYDIWKGRAQKTGSFWRDVVVEGREEKIRQLKNYVDRFMNREEGPFFSPKDAFLVGLARSMIDDYFNRFLSADASYTEIEKQTIEKSIASFKEASEKAANLSRSVIEAQSKPSEQLSESESQEKSKKLKDLKQAMEVAKQEAQSQALNLKQEIKSILERSLERKGITEDQRRVIDGELKKLDGSLKDVSKWGLRHEESSILISFGEMDGDLKDIVREYIVKNYPEQKDIILDIDGTKYEDASKVEAIVKKTSEGRWIVFTDLVGTRGNDFQAHLFILNVNQDLTGGEWSQLYGRGERSDQVRGGTYDVARVDIIDMANTQAKMKEFFSMKKELLDFVQMNQYVGDKTKALFKKIASLSYEEIFDASGNIRTGVLGGSYGEGKEAFSVTDVDALSLFRAEYNLIRKKHQAMMRLYSAGLTYTAITRHVIAALEEARKIPGAEDLVLQLEAFNNELFQKDSGGGSTTEAVWAANRPLRSMETAQTVFESTIQRARDLFKRFYGTGDHLALYGSAVSKIRAQFNGALEEIEDLSSKKVGRGDLKEASPGVHAGNANTLKDMASLASKFATAFAPSNTTTQAPVEQLANIVAQKSQAYYRGEKQAAAMVNAVVSQEAKDSFTRMSDHDKLNYLFSDVIPLMVAKYNMGAGFSREEAVLKEYLGLLGDTFVETRMIDILAAFHDAGEEAESRMSDATRQLNDHFFNKFTKNIDLEKKEPTQGFYLYTRNTGKGPILFTAYRLVGMQDEVIVRPDRDGESRDPIKTRGLILDSIDGLPDELEASLNVAESLGNGEYVLLYQSKVRNNVRDEMAAKASGQTQADLAGIEGRVRELIGHLVGGTTPPDAPPDGIKLRFTSEGSIAYNFRDDQHEKRFIAEELRYLEAEDRDKGIEETEARKLERLILAEKIGKKHAQNIESMIHQINQALMAAYDTHKVTKGDWAAVQKEVEKKIKSLKADADFNLRLFSLKYREKYYEDTNGTGEKWDPAKVKIKENRRSDLIEAITRDEASMLLSHEFGHEYHQLSIGEAYKARSGGQKERIAHLAPIAKGHNADLVFQQIYGYLSTAPDTDGWKDDYKIPTLRLLIDLARQLDVNKPEKLSTDMAEWTKDKDAQLEALQELMMGILDKYYSADPAVAESVRKAAVDLLLNNITDEKLSAEENQHRSDSIDYREYGKPVDAQPKVADTNRRPKVKAPTEPVLKEIQTVADNIKTVLDLRLSEVESGDQKLAPDPDRTRRFYQDLGLGIPQDGEDEESAWRRWQSETADKYARMIVANELPAEEASGHLRNALKDLVELRQEASFEVVDTDDRDLRAADDFAREAHSKAGEKQVLPAYRSLAGRVRSLSVTGKIPDLARRQKSIARSLGLYLIDSSMSKDDRQVMLIESALSLNTPTGSHRAQGWVMAEYGGADLKAKLILAKGRESREAESQLEKSLAAVHSRILHDGVRKEEMLAGYFLGDPSVMGDVLDGDLMAKTMARELLSKAIQSEIKVPIPPNPADPNQPREATLKELILSKMVSVVGEQRIEVIAQEIYQVFQQFEDSPKELLEYLVRRIDKYAESYAEQSRKNNVSERVIRQNTEVLKNIIVSSDGKLTLRALLEKVNELSGKESKGMARLEKTWRFLTSQFSNKEVVEMKMTLNNRSISVKDFVEKMISAPNLLGFSYSVNNGLNGLSVKVASRHNAFVEDLGDTQYSLIANAVLQPGASKSVFSQSEETSVDEVRAIAERLGLLDSEHFTLDAEKIAYKASQSVKNQRLSKREVLLEVEGDLRTLKEALKKVDTAFMSNKKYQEALGVAANKYADIFQQAREKALEHGAIDSIFSFDISGISKKIIPIDKKSWDRLRVIVPGQGGELGEVSVGDGVKEIYLFGADVVLVPAEDTLTQDQLTGLLLHEMGHVASVDFSDKQLREGITELRARQLLKEVRGEGAVNLYLAVAGNSRGLYAEEVEKIEELYSDLDPVYLDLARFTGEVRWLNPQSLPPVEISEQPANSSQIESILAASQKDRAELSPYEQRITQMRGEIAQFSELQKQFGENPKIVERIERLKENLSAVENAKRVYITKLIATRSIADIQSSIQILGRVLRKETDPTKRGKLNDAISNLLRLSLAVGQQNAQANLGGASQGARLSSLTSVRIAIGVTGGDELLVDAEKRLPVGTQLYSLSAEGLSGEDRALTELKSVSRDWQPQALTLIDARKLKPGDSFESVVQKAVQEARDLVFLRQIEPILSTLSTEEMRGLFNDDALSGEIEPTDILKALDRYFGTDSGDSWQALPTGTAAQVSFASTQSIPRRGAIVLDQSTASQVSGSGKQDVFVRMIRKIAETGTQVVLVGPEAETVKEKLGVAQIKTYSDRSAAMNDLKAKISLGGISWGLPIGSRDEVAVLEAAIKSEKLTESKVVVVGTEAYRNPALLLASFLAGENFAVGVDEPLYEQLVAKLDISIQWLRPEDIDRVLSMAARLAQMVDISA